MPFADAKYPPGHAEQATARDVSLLLAALKPFALILQDPHHYPYAADRWHVETADLIRAHDTYLSVAFGKEGGNA